MYGDWIIGECSATGVVFSARCGTCGALLRVRDGSEARAALDWHALAWHSELAWQCEAPSELRAAS